MRTREEIIEDREVSYYRNGELENTFGTPIEQLQLEVLLDIRDLLIKSNKK